MFDLNKYIIRSDYMEFEVIFHMIRMQTHTYSLCEIDLCVHLMNTTGVHFSLYYQNYRVNALLLVQS